MYEIIFLISSDTKLCIPIPNPEYEQHVYSVGSIFLQRSAHNNVRLCKDRPFFCSIDDLAELLKKALSNELELNQAFKEEGIGYLYNEYLVGKNQASFLDSNGYWIGDKYDLWYEAEFHNVTRLYTVEGKIFLDVSPYYPWTSLDEEEERTMRSGDGYIPYDEYIKHYKPVAILEISCEVAQRWLDKSVQLVKILSYNYETFKLYPDNGEQSMYNSVAWPNGMYTRFGTSEGQIVELRAIDNNPENYRGYVVRWDQLRPDVQAFLIQQGLTNRAGDVA